MSKLTKENLNELDKVYKTNGSHGFQSYTLNNELRKLDGVQYAEIKYDFFTVREVIRKNASVGEYHIKLTDQSNLRNAVSFFRKTLPSAETGLVDPEGILELEYPIFMIVKDKILQAGIMNIFSDMNEELKQTKEG